MHLFDAQSSLPVLGLGLLVGCVDLEDKIDILTLEVCEPERVATVACTLDGDTVDLDECGENNGATRVRLLGAAAPEIEHAPEPAECFGDESFAFLDDLLTGRRVTVQSDVDGSCIDPFGRTLAWLILEVDESDVLVDTLEDVELVTEEMEPPYEILVNELLIRLGYASIYRGDIAQDVRYKEDLEAAEEAAIREQRGLWGACGDD